MMSEQPFNNITLEELPPGGAGDLELKEEPVVVLNNEFHKVMFCRFNDGIRGISLVHKEQNNNGELIDHVDTEDCEAEVRLDLAERVAKLMEEVDELSFREDDWDD